MKNESDLRVIKSRANICNSFMELLTEKPLSEISIKEICDRALCSRNTFYSHFPYKEAVLDYISNECVNLIVQSCNNEKKLIQIDTDDVWRCVFNTISSVTYVKERLLFLLRYDRSNTLTLLVDKLYDHCLNVGQIKSTSGSYPVSFEFYNRYVCAGIV